MGSEGMALPIAPLSVGISFGMKYVLRVERNSVFALAASSAMSTMTGLALQPSHHG